MESPEYVEAIVDGEVVDVATGEIHAPRQPRQMVVAARPVPSDYVPAPLVSPTEIIERRKAIEAIVRENLTEGVDFGKIPGTPKPSLWKPGAERLANWFGYAITFPIELARHTEDWNAGFLDYNYTCRLIHKPTGVVVAECEGSCNSHEKKYAKAREKNATLGDQKNTLQKMAQKRALVGAVLLGCALSDRFTQDVEDTGVGPSGDELPSGSSGGSGASPSDPLDYAMPFGKHAGKTLRDLPSGYIAWMVKKGGDIAPPEVLEAARKLLEVRKPPDATSLPPEGERPAVAEQIEALKHAVSAYDVPEETATKVYQAIAKGLTRDAATEMAEMLEAFYDDSDDRPLPF